MAHCSGRCAQLLLSQGTSVTYPEAPGSFASADGSVAIACMVSLDMHGTVIAMDSKTSAHKTHRTMPPFWLSDRCIRVD